MFKFRVSVLSGLFALLALSSARAEELAAPAKIVQAVNLSIPLLQKSLAEYPRHNACFSCHHQGIPLFALSLAQKCGYPVDAKVMTAVVGQTRADLRADLASYQQGKGQPGGVTRAGYALLALQAGGVKPEEITTAVTDYLLQKDRDKGGWTSASNRPPSEISSFTDTFLAIQALKNYSENAQSERVKGRIQVARKWLEATPTRETEDRVFRLWGMMEAGSDPTEIQKAVRELMAEQSADGGWAQLPQGQSDAYATGSVLTALHLAGGLPTTDASYRRGVASLLKTQLPDGSWHVVSRSKPFQPYFESGFPHGKDQFISMAASAWATAALALAAPALDPK
jgi:squalene cyclase